MIINHNLSALNAHRQLSATNTAGQKALEKLSSGLRVNRAGDDAAGLAISEKMRGQIKGLSQASRNAQDAISLVQTAEGALNETHSMLQRMRELVDQAASDTNTTSDRQQIAKELRQLQNEISRIATQTEFNTKKLLNGSAASLTFQIGANSGQTLTLAITTMSVTGLGVQGIASSVSGGSAGTISALLTTIDNAIVEVSSQRSDLGAVQNRLEHTIANLDTSAENLQAAESRIRDVDMAKEMIEFTRTNILAQAGTAMLAQANAKPQGVLQLLG